MSKALQQYLRQLRDSGVRSAISPRGGSAPPALPKGKTPRLNRDGAASSPPSDGAIAESPALPLASSEPPASGISPSRDDVARSLAILATEVAACTRCQELATTRTQTVFGVGNPNARLCLFGEAPGADEDKQGEPFVGRSGQLLTDILKACGFTRDEVYILNVIKCRPPSNRTPEPDEVANCRGYFEQQFALIRPEFICCLGAVAARALLDTNAPLGRLRGIAHTWRASTVVVTYHPSYLLRLPHMKRETWSDMKFLLGLMGLPVPK